MSVAFVTMCANDHFWLQKWIEHNSQYVEKKYSLYVILDGEDEDARDIAAGCSVIVVPKFGGGSFEARRMRMIHSYVNGLLRYYDVVVFNDVDEFLCIDPSSGSDLVDRLLKPVKQCKVVSPIGVELLFQDEDDDIDLEKPLLSQRQLGFLNSGYCKPCMFYQPVERGNQHVIRGEPWVFDTDIYLFHCRYIDKKMLARRIGLRDDLVESGLANGAGGWGRDTAVLKFNKQKRKFLSAPEQELKVENFQGFIDVLQRRYRNGKGSGERTFGRFRVPDAMSNAL
jgi:hypothetical protein